MEKLKYYTSDDIAKAYSKLSCVQKNDVLYNAIDYMQQYNGRSRFICIALAMGFDNDIGENNTYYKRFDKLEYPHPEP